MCVWNGVAAAVPHALDQLHKPNADVNRQHLAAQVRQVDGPLQNAQTRSVTSATNKRDTYAGRLEQVPERSHTHVGVTDFLNKESYNTRLHFIWKKGLSKRGGRKG
jgi:hypothetical protein